MRVFQAIRGEQKQIHRVSKKDAVDLRVGLKTGCTEKVQSYQCEMDKYYSEIPDAKIVPLIPKEKDNLQGDRNRVPCKNSNGRNHLSNENRLSVACNSQ